MIGCWRKRQRLEEERDYLLRWFGGLRPPLRGMSADALTVVAFRGGTPRDYPHDEGDLGRCERAYAAMPRHIQERALPLLEEWRQSVAEKESAREARNRSEVS